MTHLIARVLCCQCRKIGISSPASHRHDEMIDGVDVCAIRSFDLRTPHDMSANMLMLLAEATKLQPEEICLRGLDVTPDAAERLASSAFLSRTQTIRYSEEADLDEQALAILLERGGIENLEIVGPSRTPFERQIVSSLQARFPHLIVNGTAGSGVSE